LPKDSWVRCVGVGPATGFPEPSRRRIEVPLAPGLPARAIAADAPTNGDDPQDQEGRHEDSEHDPKGDVGGGTDAEDSHPGKD